MYQCSKCGQTMSSPQDRCPACGVLLSGIKCQECQHVGGKQEFISNNNQCPKCGAAVIISGESSSRSAEGNKRHGCLTAWLILMMVSNSLGALFYLLGDKIVRETLPDAPDWAIPVLVISSLFNLVCAIAIFKWKKWGFWGFCLGNVAGIAINLTIGFGLASSLSGGLGIVLLFGVLQIGKENKGWNQLK